MKKPLTTFFLHTGFAESCSLSAYVIVHRDGFDTAEDAMVNFRDCLLRALTQYNAHLGKYSDEYGIHVNSEESFEKFFSNFMVSTNNDIPLEIDEELSDYGWITLPRYYDAIDVNRGVSIDSTEALIWSAGNWNCIITEHFQFTFNTDDRRKLIFRDNRHDKCEDLKCAAVDNQ